jgi:hypothetical protein
MRCAQPTDFLRNDGILNCDIVSRDGRVGWIQKQMRRPTSLKYPAGLEMKKWPQYFDSCSNNLLQVAYITFNKFILKIE